ncbi:MAG: preprotein translocase subunit YajC [Lachnospirales bacterium]
MNYLTLLSKEGNVVLEGSKDGAKLELNGQSVEGQSESTNETTSQTAAPSNTTGQSAAPGAGSMFSWLVIWGIFIVAMWFFMIRPQRKREKKMQEERAAIVTGDTVLLSSGMYGKVVSISENIFMIEFGTNKTFIIPVNKQEVLRKTSIPS